MSRQSEVDDELRERVLKEFYRTKLKKGEIIIDNRTTVIAKICKTSIFLASEIIENDLENKENILIKKRMEEPKELENECLWCGKPCEKSFCSYDCAIHWVQE